MQVVLEDALHDGLVCPLRLPLDPPVLGLFAVQWHQPLKGHHQEVPGAHGRVEDLELAHRLRRVLHGVLGDRLRNVVRPAPLGVGLQRHQLRERHLADLSLGPPLGPSLIESIDEALALNVVLLHARSPAVFSAHRQPHGTEAVLQQPVHHVALGEHLRLAGDLVRLDLAALVELVVQGLALGVVPVLVDPAQGHVVGPAARQVVIVHRVNQMTQRARGDRYQLGYTRLAEDAWQIRGQVLEDELQ